ncbi:GntR family transcriptional regulator [Terrarubrum flagellatum]|uniref:GntR family transcriptional regulator n=1 Tax=Terrirubrum flagellatum TaxID=2895980 RepID=UPI003144E296
MAQRAAADAIGFLPLYRQVKNRLVQRLLNRAWPPGHLLPSEIELAGELGVSQGTVRKALDEMAAERLLVRRQGRGTFVAEHDDARVLFQFFKMASDADGERVFPESRALEVVSRTADETERAVLSLPEKAQVTRIRRVRSLGGRPVILETITVPRSVFPGLEHGEIPNNIYGLYADRFGVTIARAQEKLKAVMLNAKDAEWLAVERGVAALQIDRLAIALDGRPVEWRVSLCLTDEFHYISDLT